MNTVKNTQIEQAANHFIVLYSEEIENGEEITPDAINEWFIQTLDQYSELTLQDQPAVEKEIFKLI